VEAHVHGVVSLLDDQHYRLVESLWAEIRSRLGIKGIYVTPYPHYSYHVAEHYDITLLKPLLAQVAAQVDPFEIITTGLGIFTGGLSPVVYVSVVRSPQLTQLHQLLWPQLAGVSAGILEYYHPERWMPHITLGHGDITQENLPAVISLLSAHQFEWKIPINNLALLYADESGQQDELQLQYPLGRKL